MGVSLAVERNCVGQVVGFQERIMGIELAWFDIKKD